VNDDGVPLLDTDGRLSCGCLGTQREHTCQPGPEDFYRDEDEDGDYDDNDDEYVPFRNGNIEPGDFDGGFGPDSYFARAMAKDD